VKFPSVFPVAIVGPSMLIPRKLIRCIRTQKTKSPSSPNRTPSPPPVAEASRKYTKRAGCFDRFAAVLASTRVILKADSTLPVIGLLLFKVIVGIQCIGRGACRQLHIQTGLWVGRANAYQPVGRQLVAFRQRAGSIGTTNPQASLDVQLTTGSPTNALIPQSP